MTHRQAQRLEPNSSTAAVDRIKHGVLLSAIALAASLGLGLGPSRALADVTWPTDQLLPSFPAPAATQDLILLRGSSATWEAEGPSLQHSTGRNDGDGWLCQTGIDQAARHMIYGPYDTSLPEGDNTARFRMKIDDNSADDAHQVTIDVRDNTTGTTLASREIKRKEFTVAKDWMTFALPFKIPAAGHAIELRVYWVGGAYIKVDNISVDRGSEDELALFASLKGLVNITQPRIFSYEGDAHAEGKHAWLNSLNLAFTEHTDNWALISKYKSEIKGLIVYDPAVPDSMNLATTLAGRAKALVVAPSLLARLKGAPYNFSVIEDLRDAKFANKLAVYQRLFEQYWPNLTHRVIMGLSPHHHKASLREYAAAFGAAVIWLDPEVSGESEMLDKFLSSMGPGAVYMGWWPEEGPGVERGSRHGIATVASDYATNLTMHSGMPRTVRVKPIPAKPILQNKLYVAFILSDGDNLQYVEHLMRKLWNDPARGQVPMGWTVSPAMLDAMPGALDFYYTSGTDNDNLISGPSGWGYSYPNFYPSLPVLDRFARETDDYARRSGLRVVTVWNTITGGIDTDVGESFATHAPSVLGLTAQNTGGGLTVYDGTMPGFALSCNYCTNEQAIKDHIASAAAGWDGQGPRFILIQAQPWQGVTPSTFRNVRDSLGGDYQVVRPDNWFQLLRQSQGIPIEPIAPIRGGVYRLRSRASGKCISVSDAASGRAVVQVECADDEAQHFQVSATTNGYVKLAPVINQDVVFDVSGGPGATNEGPSVIVWNDVSGTNQQWQPVWQSGRDYHLIARHSDRCLDVPGGGSDEGLQLRQWTCNNAPAQAFEFMDPVWPPPEPEPDAGVSEGDAGVPAGDGDSGDGDTGDGDTGDGDTGDGDSGDGDTGDGDDGAGDGDSGDGDAVDGGASGDGDDDGTATVEDGGGCSALPSAAQGAAQLVGVGLVLLGGVARRRRRPRSAA